MVKNPLWRYGFDPGLGGSPGEGNGNPLQYSFLEKPHGHRRPGGFSPWGLKELDTTEQLNNIIISLWRGCVSLPVVVQGGPGLDVSCELNRGFFFFFFYLNAHYLGGFPEMGCYKVHIVYRQPPFSD